MANNMAISVIIPTYKPQEYIWECLDSIKQQTLSRDKFEVIIVLNGCDEPYYTQIAEYVGNELIGYNINFIQTNVGGVSNARNIALDNAKGEYITFIDDDDYISPPFLEELYANASPDTISLCYPYAFNDGEPGREIPYGLADVYDNLHGRVENRLCSSARKFFSGPCMKLIHRDIIGDRRFDTRYKNGEDSLFMFLISDRIDRVKFTSKKATYYRRYREGSAVLRKRGRKERIINNWNCMVEYSKMFFRGGYSLYFYLSRIAAELRCMLKAIMGV